MFSKFNSKRCMYCRRQVLVRVEKPDLVLQGLLVVLTCGLWLPMALTASHWGRKYRCMECGRCV